MTKDLFESLVTIATLIVGVAIVAVIVSRNSSTGDVLKAGGDALAGAIRAAVAPVTSESNASAAYTPLGLSGAHG